MKQALRHSILFLFTVLINTATIYAHTKTDAYADVISSQTFSCDNYANKKAAAILYYICTHPREVASDHTNQSHYIHTLFRILCRLSNYQSLLLSAHVNKHQLAHFQSDHPITYYVYALRKIVI